jgi:hypothetical protein
MDINNAGDIVATIDTGGGGRVPYLYRDGSWTNLNNLMPAGTGFTIQFVTAINNRGWIVGVGTTFAPAELGQGFVLVPPNRAPVAANSAISTSEDSPVNGSLNATDADGDPIAFQLLLTGSKGVATLTDPATGAFTYVPNKDANGSDTITFKANDGKEDSNVATLSVTITPVNDAPTSVDGAVSVNSGASVAGTLVATDIDSASLSFTIATNGNKGVASVTNAATGGFSYAANVGSSGTDTFTFRANDGFLSSNVATVTVTITPTTCATDVSGLVAVSQTVARLNRKTGRYTQTVTLKNADGVISGPLSLVLDNLSPSVTLFASEGVTACTAPTGSPYVNVDIGSDFAFRSKERATINLEFVNPSAVPVTYNTRVVAGSGSR